MKSFAVWFEFRNEAPATNAIRFAEEEEAKAYADAKMMVWMMPTGFQVRPSEDAPNYTFGPTGLEAIS